MNSPINQPDTPALPPPGAPPLTDLPGEGPEWKLSPEDIPNLDNIIIEDGKPVENRFIEKQQRFLAESGNNGGRNPGDGHAILILTNVGLFFAVDRPPLVPDVMLILDVPTNVDFSRKENRSYFFWVVGKMPDLVIEVVSDRRGGEGSLKMREYARLGILYYVIFDPDEHLRQGVLRVFGLQLGTYQLVSNPGWLPEIGLGLRLWEGVYEGQQARWLRWCDQNGQVIPTGRELAEQERQRADQEQQRNERLRAQLRALGVEPVD